MEELLSYALAPCSSVFWCVLLFVTSPYFSFFTFPCTGERSDLSVVGKCSVDDFCLR